MTNSGISIRSGSIPICHWMEQMEQAIKKPHHGNHSLWKPEPTKTPMPMVSRPMVQDDVQGRNDVQSIQEPDDAEVGDECGNDIFVHGSKPLSVGARVASGNFSRRRMEARRPASANDRACAWHRRLGSSVDKPAGAGAAASGITPPSPWYRYSQTSGPTHRVPGAIRRRTADFAAAH